MTPSISVSGVSRRYHGELVLDQVNFDIEPGSITGLLGRNGAGKTTTLRIIAGQESAVVAGPLDDSDYTRARALRLTLEPLTLQQVVVHAAGQRDTHARERTSA